MEQGIFQRLNNEIGDTLDILFIVLYSFFITLPFKPIISSSPLHAVQALLGRDIYTRQCFYRVFSNRGFFPQEISHE